MNKLDCANCKYKKMVEKDLGDIKFDNPDESWIREIICFLVKVIFVGIPTPVILTFIIILAMQKIKNPDGIDIICLSILFVFEAIIGAFLSGWLLEKIDNIFYK